MMVEMIRGVFLGSKTEISTSKKRLKDGNGDFIIRGLFCRNWYYFGTDSQILILYKRKLTSDVFPLLQNRNLTVSSKVIQVTPEKASKDEITIMVFGPFFGR